LRFAVHRPGTPDASPRSHGTPCRDVLSRIHVSITGVPAGHATEQGLALATARCDVPAHRALLTCERGRNPLHPPRSLVLQPAGQQAPGRAEDSPVQPGLLPDIPAWRGVSTLGRAGHILDGQVLNTNYVEPARDVRARLLCPVLSGIGLTDLEPGNCPLGPRSAIRASHSPSQLSLQARQTMAPRRAQSRRRQHLSRRQDSGHHDAPVDADYCAGARAWNRRGNGGKRDMPPARTIPGHSIGSDAFGYVARPAEPHPSHLWHPDFSEVTVQSAHVLIFHGDYPKPLIPASLPPRRPAMGSGEVVRHSLRKVSQRLLLHHNRAFAQPVILSSRLSELPALFRETGCAFPARPPVRLLLHCQIPYKPGMGAVLTQLRFMAWGRHETIPGHDATLAARYDIPAPEGREWHVVRRFKSVNGMPRP